MQKTRQISPKMRCSLDWNGKYMIVNMNCRWKKTKLEAKFTKSSENFSKLKGKTQNFEKKLKNSSKKLKVSANPLGLLAEKPGLSTFLPNVTVMLSHWKFTRHEWNIADIKVTCGPYFQRRAFFHLWKWKAFLESGNICITRKICQKWLPKVHFQM